MLPTNDYTPRRDPAASGAQILNVDRARDPTKYAREVLLRDRRGPVTTLVGAP